ncbi:MAG TPA: hypothetical protein VHX65_12020 [Pirellulales bacterium]|nr:hypothetical protein [Pirellulales bacterium]
MNHFVYYDLEEVLADDVRRARAVVPGAREFIARGTPWPEKLEGPPPSELWNPRELEYQRRLMDWIDRLFKSLEHGRMQSLLACSEGFSQLEILRYRFLFEFSEIEQRLAVAGEMYREGAEHISWIVPESACATIRQLMGGINSPHIDVIGVERPAKSRSRLWRLFRSCGRRVIDGLMNSADVIARDPRDWVKSLGESVAIVEYYPNSAKALIPVAKALREEHGVETIWIAARRQVKVALERHGVASTLLRRLSPTANRRPKRLPAETAGRLREAIGADADESLFFGTGSLFGKSLLAPAIVEKLSGLLQESAFWLDSLTEAFARVQPLCVVSTTYSSMVGRAAALAARRRNIPSAFVQHGMFPDYDVFTRFCNDAIFVWGHANQRTIHRNGIANSRIRVVGPAIYDELIRRKRLSKRPATVGQGNPLEIAYMASRTGGQVVSVSLAKLHLMAIVRAAAVIPNSRLTVKVHPADYTGIIDSVLRQHPHVRIVREGSSQDVTLQSDVVIVVSSTTGLEACIADKPLIVIETKGLSEYGPYRQYGAAIQVAIDHVDDSERLAIIIRQLSTDSKALAELAEGRRRLVDDLLNGGRADATELTARAIVELFRGRSESSEVIAAARAKDHGNRSLD